MARKYFVLYYKDFGNIYYLHYTENPDQEKEAAALGYERITRKEAISMARTEKRRHKWNGAFSGYSSSIILPWDVERSEYIFGNPSYTVVDCIAERI